MHRAVFVYARNDSKRLPGKALIALGSGGPLLSIVLNRARMVGAESCALVTSNRGVDDGLAEMGAALGVQVVRGDAVNLVRRTIQAIHATGASHFLRVNGDSPFFSPRLAQQAMTHLNRAVLISNLFERRFPYGVAVEWVAASAYQALASSADDAECEHVTAHLYRKRAELSLLSMTQARDDSKLQLTIDTIADHKRLTALLGQADPVQAEYWNLYGIPVPQPLLNLLKENR
ncbi:NTP transferase domain-containing protein [Cyanobium sp. FACHB-13342]|uniref:cytidylyltransferase domain-containing protein n=1 Tax=Cyanobium sp. FACHB-13342 TaxID=2692793 RepID=UPI00168058B7|nr:NTP transferase domain-containing protein [Cyanobium sp. FACHB-13342]MBD2422486.1 NTP transferase domain-containing protein [Cyanobium sp. FACHB-13342]